MPRVKVIKLIRVCEVCGTSFEVFPCYAHARFCSSACYHRKPKRITALEVRFRKYVGPTTDKGCILWIGCLNENGYGVINDRIGRGKNILAHRLSWELANGPLSDDMAVLHRCDNPPCVNVEHLFLGTDAVNVADMISKGRHSHGTRRPGAKLTDELVLAIRGRYALGGVTQYELADQFGVVQSIISRVVLRQIWKHV